MAVKKLPITVAFFIAAVIAAATLISTNRSHAPTVSHPAGMRIVSLSPSTTEILFELGVGDKVVGVTNRCDWPEQARHIEQVGGFGSPNMEHLMTIRPDIVIACGFQRTEMAQAIKDAGIDVLDVKIRNFEELFAAIDAIGAKTGASVQARALITKMQNQLNEIAARHKLIPKDRRVRVFVEIWHDPLTTAGGGSFINDLIEQAGGINVAAELPDAYLSISPEKVIEWNPDVIVTAAMDATGQNTDKLRSQFGWSAIKAVADGKIISDISLDILLRPGPRLIQGADALEKRFYPVAPMPQTSAAQMEHQ